MIRRPHRAAAASPDATTPDATTPNAATTDAATTDAATTDITSTDVSAARARRLRAALLLTAVAITGAPAAATADEASPEPAPRAEYACETGEFCLWPEKDYGGEILRLDLRNTNPEECRALPDGVEARAFGNRLDRHVTVYQDRHCATEGDFSTFPGPGTFVPQSPYVVRAVKIWN